MILKASIYLHFNHVAINLWSESDGAEPGPLVIRSVRHTYVEVPEHLAALDDLDQCLQALRWAVETAVRHRAGQDRQLGS